MHAVRALASQCGGAATSQQSSSSARAGRQIVPQAAGQPSGLIQKVSLIRAELDLSDCASAASAIKAAHRLMGTPAIGTLPQQADTLLHALGFPADAVAADRWAGAPRPKPARRVALRAATSSPPPSPPDPDGGRRRVNWSPTNSAPASSDHDPEEHSAAARVQARYRGNKRRSEEAEEHRHASKLQAVFRGHRARQTAELRSSQKRALAEMKARQQALAEQEKHATATLKVDLPKDWRHRIARLLDKPRSSWASMSVLVVLMLAIIASLLSFFMCAPARPALGARHSPSRRRRRPAADADAAAAAADADDDDDDADAHICPPARSPRVAAGSRCPSSKPRAPIARSAPSKRRAAPYLPLRCWRGPTSQRSI